MSETRFDELRRYVRLTATDGDLLRTLGQHASPEFPRIAREFYDRIREHEQAHAVFTSEEQVQRLHSSLVRWMERVCSGHYDEAYFAETAKIGRVHVRIGLPQRYMFTAMALVRIALMQIADRVGVDAAATREALNRVLDLELAIMLETYQESLIERIQRAERLQMAELGRTLARTEHRYVSAVEHVPALIVGLGEGGEILLCNREVERVSGLARHEVYGRRFADMLVTSDLRKRVQALVTQLAMGETPSYACEAPLTLQAKAGHVFDVAWKFAHVPGAKGDVVLLAMGLDVTNAKALEERARQAERLAAIGALMAGLAHEIRNPLNGARLHVVVLERAIRMKGGDEEMLDATRVVGGEIQKLADLVSSFLDFARPRPLAIQRVHLSRICERAVNAARPAANASAVRLAADLPDQDISFDADPAKLEQVLANLLANAIEALENTEGGHAIVRARRVPRHVVVEVEDNGPGLASPEMPIFDAFFSTKKGGRGLGLAIAHRIVTDHGGSIEVTKGPPRTVFRVTLPLSQTRRGMS